MVLERQGKQIKSCLIALTAYGLLIQLLYGFIVYNKQAYLLENYNSISSIEFL